MKNHFLAGACALALLPTSQALAKHVPDTLPRITIPAVSSGNGSLTQPNVELQRKVINQNAGSIAFVDGEDYKTRYASTIRDALKDTPGVFVQNRYGQETRVSIRGSGIARGFHTRGVEILQDGISTNLADGSGDYYQIDPLALRSVEVYKGGNGLAYGSSMLGGAINFVTPTAHTAVAPNILRLDAGSFGTVRTNAQISRVVGDADFLINGTMTHEDGYRDHRQTQAETVNANIGYRFNPDVETRFYLGSFNVDQELPGTVTLANALNNPTKASAAALAGDQKRDSRTQRIANRTSFKIGGGQLDVDTWAIHKSLFHPIFQVIDQDGWTYGIGSRYKDTFTLAGFRNDIIMGTRFNGGNNTALQYLNNSGSRGAQTLNAQQDAFNAEAYLENRFWFLPQAAVMTGAKLFHDERTYHDHGNLALNPTPKEDSKNYDGINPKLGLLWQPKEDIQIFTDITRSQDVPDFSDLNQTIGTTTAFVPLKAQDAWTAEIGTRGHSGRYGWDITAYRSWIDNELMQYTTNPNVPAATFNAGSTVHQGIEFGFSTELARDVLSETSGDMLTLNQLWNYSDFHFVDDLQYGNNSIAGVPEHVLRTGLTYKHKNGFYLNPGIDWVPDGAWADQANTLKAPGYVLFGLQTGMQFDNGVLLYLEARNLTNEHYISDISTIRDARTTGTEIFHPGDGRSVFTGIRYAF
ncbi:MAG: TonB-dependent receptor [Alphaproteobacteria bacterium]|nr:TonB-dependent receptor [Alphaproteobacteria bacterium]